MTTITNVKVYDLMESVVASRNAMRTEPFIYSTQEELAAEFERSLTRAIKLVQHSAKDSHVKCHDNFLTGIRVSFDIVYPQYISPELQRYHWIDIVTSASKMHRLFSMEADKQCNEYTPQQSVDALREAIHLYNFIAQNSEIEHYTFTLRNGEERVAQTRDEALYYARMIATSAVPAGYQLFMRVSTNYKQLQTIYWQRHDHRLKEDWGEVIRMIRELPYCKEFILGELPESSNPR